MIDDKDVKKIIKAFKDVFPTAEMVQKGFVETAKKSEMNLGFTKVNKRLDRIEIGILNTNWP